MARATNLNRTALRAQGRSDMARKGDSPLHNAKHITARTRFLRHWRPGRKVAGIIGAAALVVAAGASYGGFALASAGTASTIIASTAVSNHPDTTNATGGTACTPSDGGPVWAKDNFT